MKKKWVVIVLGLLLVGGIGVKVYMDKQAEKKEAEKVQVERMSVEALKNTFENIKSVQIESSSYNIMTDSYLMFTKMTNRTGETVYFNYTFEQGDDEVGYIMEDEEIQSEGFTTDKIQIIYSNNQEGEF